MAAAVMLAGGALASGLASADKPEVVRAGNLEVSFNGSFTPKTLSRTKLTPIKLSIESDIGTVDGSHPPALREFIVEGDRNAAFDVEGIPVCHPSEIQATDTKHAEAACRPAIIGSGQATGEIQFPESPGVLARSKIIVFNGGVKGAVTTLYVHAFITVPTPVAIVSTVKIRKVGNGRYGTEAVTTIPQIAGGSGSVTHFDLTFTWPGVLRARCADGKLQARVTAAFSDDTRASAAIIRACKGK